MLGQVDRVLLTETEADLENILERSPSPTPKYPSCHLATKLHSNAPCLVSHPAWYPVHPVSDASHACRCWCNMTVDDLVREHWSANRDFKRVKSGWDVPVRRPRAPDFEAGIWTRAWLWSESWWPQSGLANSSGGDAAGMGWQWRALPAASVLFLAFFWWSGTRRL